MMFYALRQRREGRLLPRHTLHPEADCVRGELRVTEERDSFLQRACRVAHLTDAEQSGVDVLPPLKDATLLYIDHARVVITGFEQLSDRDYAQTWMLTIDPDALHSLYPIQRPLK